MTELKKYEDGVWFGRYEDGDGDFGALFLVKEQSFSRRLPDGKYYGVSCTFLPLYRVADLDGRPVVEASVIEAIAKDISKTENKLLGTSLPIEELTDILRESLAARKDENKDEVAALPEPAERPIVNLPGAFVCWHKISGTQFTAWADESGFRYIRQDGRKSGWDLEVAFHDKFTRTPPPPLSQELESLVKPLAQKLGKTETEVRGAILAAQGAGA